jgi:hypothetical protein
MKNALASGRLTATGLAVALAGAAAVCVAVPSVSEAIGCYGVASDAVGASTLDGDYNAIMNEGSDLPLALAATSGTARFAEQGSMWPNAAVREWSLTSVGVGEYKIVNASRGEVLESVGRADRTGTYYDRAGTWNGASTQIWMVTPAAASGSYTLTNKKTGRVLAVRNGSTAVGAAIQEVSPTGSVAELWSFELSPTIQPCDPL